MLYIGTAGWSVPSHVDLPREGTHLQRYSLEMRGVEINSSFYREHKYQTYERWAQETPKGFRFSVKLSREFTHDAPLRIPDSRFARIFEGISGLEDKWAVLLVQLPPKLEFEPKKADRFFTELRKYYGEMIALEPRHMSWGTSQALDLLNELEITKVEADPERCPSQRTSPERGRYIRWHGSPQIYRSSYSHQRITALAEDIKVSKGPVWCIFDNTAMGHALENALELKWKVQA